MKQFPRKQVHLDFHTSPDIPCIGSRFDKAQFQAALKAGHLDSITVFAKCHHGYCYSMSTTIIIVTLNVWNEFMTPLLFIQSRENDVILQEVSRNIGQFATDWTAMFPMLMLGVAPLMIFYVFMQKYIIGGVAAGAVKG